jgi:anti-sigma regulatory factor (Ser/Thr protein kinase)
MARDVLLDLCPQFPPRAAADLRILLSELVTNAIEHAGLRKGETIGLDVRIGRTKAEMVVRYPEHVGFEPTFPPDADGASGWGLVLVDRISDRWSVVESEGQVVTWCEVDVPDHEAALSPAC